VGRNGKTGVWGGSPKKRFHRKAPQLAAGIFTFDGGVGRTQISFDKQNPQHADIVKVSGGLGSLEIDRLLNANARAVTIHGGGSSMRIDFTGETPARDLTAHISIGVGRVVLNVSDDMPTQVFISQGLGHVRIDDSLHYSGHHTYETPDFGKTGSPRLLINVTSGVGSVVLNMVSHKVRVPII
jgi:hypothetical protein